jgi:membrane-associated phospholipid phosphatase/methionine-rich copper-binding protein CopC
MENLTNHSSDRNPTDLFSDSTQIGAIDNIFDVNSHKSLPQQLYSNQFTEHLNNTILPLAQTALQEFERSPDFATKMNLAFGNGFDLQPSKSRALLDSLTKGEVIPIEILPSGQIQAKGAFGNDRIYLSEDLVNPATAKTDEAVSVLLEEIGHYIDSQINEQDASGDEGAIFAKLVQNQAFKPGELSELQVEDDWITLNINGKSIAIEQASLDQGIFDVDATGKLTIDFLADSGSYHSEMAVFSLKGMETLVPGSIEFMKEAARRALSNSSSGYVVIADATEGARFTQELGESNKNDGKYTGIKTFDFTAGDRVAMMIVPSGTIRQVFDNPSVDGNQRPLFSIANANPNQSHQLCQLLPDTFGWEDMRLDRGGDADYNDFVFQIKGATGIQVDVDKLVAVGKEWQNLPVAKEIFTAVFNDKNPPDLNAGLADDTGFKKFDRLTYNPEVVGKLTDDSGVKKFKAKFSDGEKFVDILSAVQADGSFTLNVGKLARIKGSDLTDGYYKLILQAEDKFGKVAESVVEFTLDTQPPAAPTEIKIKDDLDLLTNKNTPTIVGKGDTGSKVSILDGDIIVGEGFVTNGAWEITTSTLADGIKNLRVKSIDRAGNCSEYIPVSITVDTVKPVAPTEINIKDDPDLITNLTTPIITGKAETGTTVQIFDGTTKLGEATAVNGAFEITTSALADGVKNLSVKSIDLAGNVSDSTAFTITVDTTKPVINVSLLNDTGVSISDRVTSDATITGKVTDANSIAKFQAKLNSGNFVDVLAKLNPDGGFSLDKATLTQINGGKFPDGIYQLSLQAEDKAGNVTEAVKLDFTLDSTAPPTLGFMLDSLFDSAPIGDSQTTFATVNILGQTEANATVTIKETGASVTADAQGKFKLTGVALALGDNSFTVNSIDLAGNVRSQTGIIKRVETANSDVVLDWNANLLNAIYTDKTAPPVASRNMAIVESAVFDAVNSFAQTYKNYHFTGTAPVGGSVEAAAASAAYNTLLKLYPNQKTFFDNAFTASLAKITDGAAEDAGVVFGKTVADDILSLRSNDGASKTVTYNPGTNPGDWQPTAPGFAAALLPQWGSVTPFGLTSGAQFRPAGDPALTSDQYTAEFDRVKDLGSINSTTRTADQTQIAQFWADGAGTFTPPGHWNQIAQNVAATKGNSLLDNARLFALLDISLADAGIAAWDAKYQYNSWRPITAIQQADTDGNPNTIADPNWKPLITTPPFPEYISGHSTFSGAAATVLTSLLGDNISFNLNSLGMPGVDRQFSSFNAAATEAGISRIYGGIHFNSANIDGLATGNSVGNYVLQNLLGIAKPVAPTEVKIKDDVDTVTNLKTPIITGKATTGNIVQIFDGTTKLGEATAVNGVFEITTSALTDGVKNLTVKSVNTAGTVSDNTAFALTVDTVKPVAPTELKIKDDPDTVTNLTTPVITGKAETGTTVQIFDGTTKLGEVVTVNGVFEVTTSTLTDGVKNLTVKSVDVAGNVSDNTAFSLTVDTVKPVAPTEIKIKDDPDTVTNLKTPVITGKAETGTTVQIFDGTMKLGEAVAVNGVFEVTTSTLTDGVKNLTVKSIDLAGNISDNTAFSLTVDTTVVVVKPVAPSAIKIKDDTDTLTNLKTPIITGQAPTGTTVQIFDGTTKLGEAVAVNGAFEITTSALTDGVKNLTVKAVDPAGNTSDNTAFSLTVDTVKPVAPTELKIKDDPDTVTNLKTPIITGKAETGTTVQIFDGTTKLGEAVAVNGVFEVTTSTLTDGVKNLTVKSIDLAGNISDNTAFSLTVDTTVVVVKPVAPSAIKIKDDTDTLTNLKTPIITGQAPTGTTVQIFDGTTKLGEAVAVNGAFEITTSSLTDGVKNLTVKAVDSAGNASDNTAFSLTVDTLIPILNLTTPAANAQITTGAKLQGTVDGTGSGISKVSYRFGTGTEITVPVNAQGQFDVELNLAGLSGQQSLILKSVDTAGNTTESTLSVTVGADITPPKVALASTPSTAVNYLELTFDEPVTEASFAADKYSLKIVGGIQDGTAVTIASIQKLSPTQVRVNLAAPFGSGNYKLAVAAGIADAVGNATTAAQTFDLSVAAARLSISPANGEEMVGLNRDTVVNFGKKIDPTTVNSDNFYLIANGQRVAGKIKVSSTEEFATFFYDSPLPSSTEVRVVVDGSKITGRDGVTIDGDGDGKAGGIATADFTTLPLTRIKGTDVWGYVYDSYNKNADGSNIPLKGVTIRLDSLADVFATTDEKGYFILKDVPAPEFFVYIDGAKATGSAAASQYASLGKPFHSVPGQSTQLVMDGTPFNVYLPPMAASDVKPLSATETTQVGFGVAADAFLQKQFPNIAPDLWKEVKVTFAPGSAQDDAGNKATQAMIIPVDPQRLPAPLPPGADPKLVISIQAGGAGGFNREAKGGSTNFDVPAPIQFPNLDGLKPGEKSLFWSFDHDAGKWIVIGSGTVSADGKTIVSDPGVGVIAPGWHFTNPGGCAGSGGAPPSPPKPDTPKDTNNESEQAIPLITGESGSLFTPLFLEKFLKKEWKAPDRLPDTPPPPAPSSSCSPPPRTPDPDRKQPYIQVKIEVDGPLDEFMKQQNRTTEPLTGSTFTLMAGSGEKRSLGVALKSYAEMATRLNGTNRAPFSQLNENILFGSKVVITEVTGKPDGSKHTEKTSYYLYRFIDATDADRNDGQIEFEDTLVRGTRTKPIIFDTGSATPQLSTSGDFAISDSPLSFNPTSNEFSISGVTLSFNPTSVGLDRSGTLTIKTPTGKDIGSIQLNGDGEARQKFSINYQSFIDAIIKTIESYGLFGGMTENELIIFGYNEERNKNYDPVKISSFVNDVIIEAESLLSPFSTGLERVTFSSSSSGVVEFNQWQGSSSRTDVLGNSFVVDNKNGIFNTDDIFENRTKYSKVEQNFRLSEALNENYNGNVEVYVNQYFLNRPKPDLNRPKSDWTRSELVNSLGKTIAHELGHTVGLNHTSSPKNPKLTINPNDVMAQGFVLDAKKSFSSTMNAFNIALGLPWNESQAQQAVQYYSAYIGSGGRDAPDGVDDPESQPSRPVNDGLLWLLEDGSKNFTNKIDFGNVNITGSVATLNFVLTNAGDRPATIDNVSLAGNTGQFTISNFTNGLVLAPGENKPITIGFDPSKVGNSNATLVINSDALQPVVEIPLTGFGQSTSPYLSFNTPNNNLGGVAVAGSKVEKPNLATITNYGTEPLNLSDIKLVEGNSSFGLLGVANNLGTNPISLKTGESWSFGVNFDPSKVGLDRAVVEITSNDPNNSKSRFSFVGTGLDKIVYPDWGNDYIAIEMPNLSGNAIQRIKSDKNGNFQTVLAPNQYYHMVVFDPLTGLVSHSYGYTPSAGQGIDLTASLVFNASTATDTDGDGLPDDIEFAIGTAASKIDTDGDSIRDFVEIYQGTDPLGGQGFPTGIIATLPLQGEAKAVVVSGSATNAQTQTAYVATGSHGLAIVNASRFDNPIILGQLDLPGDATSVGVDNKLKIAAVATNSGGLQLVNVADGMLPTLIKTVSLAANKVEVAEGIAYAAVGNVLHSIDLTTGDELQSLTLPGPGTVTGLAREGSKLYAYVSGSDTFLAIDISAEGSATVLGQLVVTVASSDVGLTVGNGVAYLAGSGLRTIDISKPNTPTLISNDNNNFFTARNIALNGSGLALVSSETQGLAVYNVADPQKTDAFVTILDTPGTVYDSAVASGIAFAADGSSGLQVINYLPFDNKGKAPTISISANVLDLDLNTAGIQVQEGSTIPIRANIADDVQVRNVELLVDGQVTANDVSFPWDLSVVAPKIANGKTTVDIQVRATDTGGNISLSNLLTLNLSPDKFAPKVLVTTPAAGARSETIPSVVVTFDEAIDPTKLSVAGVTLTNLGKDGILSGGDDLVVPVISLQTRSFDRTLVITPTSELPLGNYQLKLDPGTIGDRAGNSLTAPFTLDFTKRTSLTYGTTINGNLAQAGDDEVYTLKATAGSRIIFDRLLNRNTDIDIEFQLTSPSGKSITQVSTYNGYAPITLTETGNYIATVKSANNSTGDYSFRLVDTQAAPTITLGTTVTDTLSDLAELDAYQIDGKAGQRLFFNDQIEAGNNSGWNWALYGTDNQQLIKFSGRDFNDFEAVLPRDGKYLLVLTQNIPGQAIDYSFNVTSPPTTTTSLKLGDIVNSKIAELGAINEYTFTGIPGQRLYFDTLIAGSNIATQLIGPRGQVVFNRSASNVPFTLTEAGTYKLIFNGYGSLGDYSFRLLDAAAAKPIELGTVQTGTLTLDSGVNVYRIDGTAGQKLFFDALVAAPNGLWTLYGPNNQYLFNSLELGTDFEAALTTDGTYLLVLSGDNVNYSFNVTNSATTTTALTLGTTFTGKLARAGSEEVYTLNATAGSRIIFDRLFSTTYIPIKLQLTSPSGNSITQVSTSNDGLPVILAETGTYTATVKSYDNSTGDYSFRLVDTNTALTITLGTTVTDTLSDLAELDAYQIDGKAGQRLFFNNLNPLIAGGNDSIWTLYGTDNQFLANALGYKNFVTVLPNDGKYLLVLTRNSPGKAIDYNFKVTSPPTTTTVLNVGATVTNKSLELGAINEYTFTGVPGQRLYLDTLGISAQLISPSGQFVFYSDPKSPFILSEAGTYKLIFDGYSDLGTEARDYSFRLLDTAVAKPIVFGTVETDTLTPDLGGNVYRIDGKAGQKLYFDALVAANIGLWTLYDPNNQSLTSIGLDTDFEAALTTDGIYLLVINGDRVNYSFNVTNPATTTTPLTLGTTFTGKIAQLGEVNEYTFTGAVGQRLYYDGAIDNSTSTIFCQLVSPTGQIVFNLSDADLDRAPFTLTEAGTYKLTFNAYGSLGDYSFRLLDTGLATALTPGMTVTDTLTPGLEADIYRIDGKAGQKLYFDSLLTATSGTWTLYGVNNQSVASSGLGRDFETTLSDGTYFLVISGDNANGNTNYSFKVTEIEPTTQALTLGSTITSSIAQSGQQDVYTFTGAVGQRLYYDGLINNTTSTIYSQLISPSGQTVFGNGDADADLNPVTLTEVGTYKLILYGYLDNTGDYSFKLIDATAAPNLSLNTNISGTLDPGLKTEIYRINGTAGQKLKFDSLLTGSVNGTWILYNANNQVLSNNNLFTDFTTTLPNDGTYLLTIAGSGANGTVNYNFQVTDVSDPIVTKSGFNTIKTGSIAAGGQDTYTIVATAGTLVYFDSQSPSATNLTIEVRDPSNQFVTSFVASNDVQPLRLNNSGNYNLTVKGLSATSTGTYRFQAIDITTAATAITLGETVTSTLTNGAETVVYKFSGSIGQKIYYDAIQSDPAVVNAQIISPSDITIFNNNSNSLLTLTEGGTYYLFLNGNNTAAADYSFNLIDTSTSIG